MFLIKDINTTIFPGKELRIPSSKIMSYFSLPELEAVIQDIRSFEEYKGRKVSGLWRYGGGSLYPLEDYTGR